jgi:Arc/MetJ-type ribon-helix-helix transcriptional regulator
MKAISLRLEESQYERLRLVSFASRQPVSEIIRDAIEAYLQKKQTPKPGQEWFWSEAWQAAEREAEADLVAGNFETFESDADFLTSLR